MNTNLNWLRESVQVGMIIAVLASCAWSQTDIDITPGFSGSTASANDGNMPAGAVDTDFATRWSANGDGQWLQLDLRSPRTVSFVKIAFFKGNERMAFFEIQVSSGGGAWRTVWSGSSSGTTTGFETFDFGDVSARWVRYLGHGNSINKWNSITEIGVFARSSSGFRHPGVLVNQTQLDIVKAKVQAGAQPWKGAFDKVNADSRGSLSYTPHPRAIVECGPNSNPNLGCTDERGDALAAYTHALLWYFKGDRAHARKSIEILNAWSSTISDHTNHNAPLQTGWAGSLFAAGAEIIRHTDAGWAAADVERFETMLRNVYLPKVLRTTCANGNWESIMTNASIAISVFLDDRASFDRALTLWRNRVPAYSYQTTDGTIPRQTVPDCGRNTRDKIIDFWHGQNTFVNGIGQETCRDFGHMEWGLIAQVLAAETAYQQGVDLYSEQSKRLRDAFEFHANYDLGAPVPSWLCGGSVKTATSQSWEIVYNHFVTRKKFSLPLSKRMIEEKVRPSGTSHFYGWDTLTHAGVGNVGIR